MRQSVEKRLSHAILALSEAAHELGMTVGTVNFHGLPDWPLKALKDDEAIYHEWNDGHVVYVMGVPIRANQEDIPEGPRVQITPIPDSIRAHGSYGDVSFDDNVLKTP